MSLDTSRRIKFNQRENVVKYPLAPGFSRGKVPPPTRAYAARSQGILPHLSQHVNISDG
jgi:hypothetical protein